MEGVKLTQLLVQRNIARATAWYRDVPGTEIARESGGSSVVFHFLGSWLLLTDGEFTADKPDVECVLPPDPLRASAERSVRVPDCQVPDETLSKRGAEFLMLVHRDHGETRTFFRDHDGHLFEIVEV